MKFIGDSESLQNLEFRLSQHIASSRDAVHRFQIRDFRLNKKNQNKLIAKLGSVISANLMQHTMVTIGGFKVLKLHLIQMLSERMKPV